MTIDSSDSASTLFQSIAKATKFSPYRLRITKGSDGSVITNTSDVTIAQTGLRNKSTIDVKDLGEFSHEIFHPLGLKLV